MCASGCTVCCSYSCWTPSAGQQTKLVLQHARGDRVLGVRTYRSAKHGAQTERFTAQPLPTTSCSQAWRALSQGLARRRRYKAMLPKRRRSRERLRGNLTCAGPTSQTRPFPKCPTAARASRRSSRCRRTPTPTAAPGAPLLCSPVAAAASLHRCAGSAQLVRLVHLPSQAVQRARQRCMWLY